MYVCISLDTSWHVQHFTIVFENSKWCPKCFFFWPNDNIYYLCQRTQNFLDVQGHKEFITVIFKIWHCYIIPKTSNWHPTWRIFQQSYDNVVILLFSYHICWVFLIIFIIPYPIFSSLFLIANYNCLIVLIRTFFARWVVFSFGVIRITNQLVAN